MSSEALRFLQEAKKEQNVEVTSILQKKPFSKKYF